MTAPVILTSPEELARIVREAVRVELEARREPEPKSEWMLPDEVAALLRVKVDSLRKVRGLPSHKRGRGRRYLRAEVEAWMLAGEKAA